MASSTNYVSLDKALQGNYCKFIQELSVVEVNEYLLQIGVFTLIKAQDVRGRPTPHEKATCLLDCLRKCDERAALPGFVEALVYANQRHLAMLISPELTNAFPEAKSASSKAGSSSKTGSPFDALIKAVNALKPAEKTTERSASKYLTATEIYYEKAPESGLSIGEIPFCIAVKSGIYSTNAVLGWPDAPTKSDFGRALAVYKTETAPLIDLIESLEKGGFEFVIKTTNPKLVKLFGSFNKSYISATEESITIVMDKVDIDRQTTIDLNIMSSALHLMCFAPHSFIVRRSFAPKPNGYLLYQAKQLQHSSVIASDNERTLIENAINEDESVDVAEDNDDSSCCPW